MQNKVTTKLVIDKYKLDVLFRLGCPEQQIINLLKTNTFEKTGDPLIDDTLESLIDVKEFENWGGKREGAGRPKNQVDIQVENQVDNQDGNQDAIQVADKDKDKEKSVLNSRNNSCNLSTTRTRVKEFTPPTLEQVLDYAKQQNDIAGMGGFACTPELADQFWTYYESQGWIKGNSAKTPISDWKPLLRRWATDEHNKLMAEKAKEEPFYL